MRRVQEERDHLEDFWPLATPSFVCLYMSWALKCSMSRRTLLCRDYSLTLAANSGNMFGGEMVWQLKLSWSVAFLQIAVGPARPQNIGPSAALLPQQQATSN